MNLAMRLLDAVNHQALPFMATGATELIRWMGAIGQQDLASRVCFERMRFVFETNAVDRQMATLTAVDSSNRLIEAITVEFLHHGLLDLRNFVERHWTELEGRVLHHPSPSIALGAQLANLSLNFLAARIDLLDLFSEVIALLARGFQLRVEFRFLFFKLLNMFRVRLGISSLLNRVIVFVPGFFELAFDEFHLLIDFSESNSGLGFLPLQGRKLFPQ